MKKNKSFAWKESIVSGIVSGLIVVIFTSTTAFYLYKRFIAVIIESKVVVAEDGTKYTFMSNGGLAIEEKNGGTTYIAPQKSWL